MIFSSSEKKSAATRCINHILPVSIYLALYHNFERNEICTTVFLKWMDFRHCIRSPEIFSSNPADSFSKTISDEWISITIFKKNHFPSVFHRSSVPDRVLQRTWPKVNLNTYTFIDNQMLSQTFFNKFHDVKEKVFVFF